jgi:hypothetical protein
MSIRQTIYLLILFVILISSPLSSKNSKKLTIKGLKIYSEEEIYSELQLKRFEEGKKPLAEVISSIEKFYKKNNFPLIKVYSTDVRTSNEYVLFVDEGRLGKIVVHNLNNYYSLKFRQQIDIPKRIYNTETLNKNLNKLKKKFPQSKIAVELRQPPDYESNIIQLDREIERLKLGEIFDIELFDRYIPLHDLHFIVTDSKGTGTLNGKTEGIGYNISYRFPSVLIPEISFYKENNFAAKDYFESSLSAGINPGLRGFFTYPPSNTLLFPPEITFIELTGEYKISPMQNKFIGPLLRGRVYHSNTARSDLGITEYKYLNVRATLAPEITLLKNLNVYAGIGTDQIAVYDSEIDYEMENHFNESDDIYHNTFAEARLKFDPIPVRIGNRIDKYVIITYTSYLAGKNANQLEVLAAYDTEFENLSILSFRSKTFILYGDSRFYQQAGVNNTYFKGFPGDSYYSGKKTSLSGEYRFSIYQDYIYAGGYIEAVAFEPEGYVLSGSKQGINFGPTARFLLYDQFELIGYFGFHRLLPDNITGTNFQIKLTKKW